jgi:hypothetical protein
MDGSSSMERRKQEHKKIILLGFITYKSFNCKALRTNLFEGGYYDMTPRGAYMGLNVYDMTLRGPYMGLNVYDMTPRGGIYGVKSTCNV